jgi:hypothetical protein
MRRTSMTALIGIGLALVALTAATAVPGTHPLSRVSRTTPFAADCNGPVQTGAAFVNAEIEPYVDVNPRNLSNLVAVYQQDRFSNGGANGNLTSISFDGGRSWRVPPLGAQPRFSRCAGGTPANGGDFERATDPWVSFGPGGRAYQAAVSFNDSNPDQAELVATSTDGGRSWGRTVTLLREDTPDVSNERPAVTADFTRPGHAYVVWDRLVTAPEDSRRGPTLFTRSADGGRTWTTARPIYTPPLGDQTSGNQVVVLPNGDLLNFFDEFPLGTQNVFPRRDLISVTGSTDRGRTWSAPVRIARPFQAVVTDPRTGDVVRTGDIFPEVAADERPGSTSVYAVWEESIRALGDRKQILFSRSRDAGRTWSTPQRVSANPSAHAFVPSIAVNTRGQLALTYYDFSPDTTAGRPLDTSYWITFSSDSGQSWTDRKQVAPPFDMRTAPVSGGFFLGEYQGLEAAGRAFTIVATLANSGSLTNRTDIYARTISPHFR